MKFLAVVLSSWLASIYGAVRFERVPEFGIQPQLVAAPDGRFHLLYFKGDAMGGDLFYATRSKGEKVFSAPVKVNQQPGSVLVAGTMRGAQMSLGRDGKLHVVWMGGNGAGKVSVSGQNVTPLLYTRLNDAKDGFERERNILTHIAGLDGGQTVAADQRGNVYVVWHGAAPGVEDEEERGLYVARSTDDGKTFARETKAELSKKGACACCGLRASVDQQGALHVLFRVAEAGVNRAELWLKSEDNGKSFNVVKEDPWKIATCPASSAALQLVSGQMVGAWETDNRVVGAIRTGDKTIDLRPGGGLKQKHPTIAMNPRGDILMTWVEEAGWGTEGTLVNQVFDRNGKAVGEKMTKRGLPPWSFGAPYAEANGDFVVLY